MKDRDNKLGGPAAKRTWVDGNWNKVEDLIDEMSGRAKVETLFFDERVETSKKRCRQNVRSDNCTVEGEMSLREN